MTTITAIVRISGFGVVTGLRSLSQAQFAALARAVEIERANRPSTRQHYERLAAEAKAARDALAANLGDYNKHNQ